MRVSAPLSPKDARHIALRQGLLSGTVAGCLTLLSTACRSFVPIFSSNIIYLMAFIAFFIAGWRSAKRTGRIDMGALAGFWAGVTVAVFGVVVLFVAFYGTSNYRSMGLSSLVNYGYGAVTTAFIALLIGPAIGTLGGFIGKIYAEDSTPPSATMPPSAPQPTQPSSPQQNQP